jgi:hypothetical protein
MHAHRLTSLALAGVIALVLVAPVAAQQEDSKPAQKVKRDKYVLTADEIAERPAITNAYDAVRMLRPTFLKLTRKTANLSQSSDPSMSTDNTRSTDPYGRGAAGSYVGPVLYIDEMKHQTVEELKNFRVADIVEIRFLTGTEATNRYGDGHEGGAILLKTNRAGGG